MKKIFTVFTIGVCLGLIGGVFGYRAWMTKFPTGNPFAKTEAATTATDPFAKDTDTPSTLPGGIPIYEKMKFKGKRFDNGRSEFFFSAEGSGEDIYKFYQDHFTQAGWRKVDSYSPRWTKDRTICEYNVQGSSTGNYAGIPTCTITFRFSEVTIP